MESGKEKERIDYRSSLTLMSFLIGILSNKTYHICLNMSIPVNGAVDGAEGSRTLICIVTVYHSPVELPPHAIVNLFH